MMLEEEHKEFAVKSFITKNLDLVYRILKLITLGIVLEFQNVVLFFRNGITLHTRILVFNCTYIIFMINYLSPEIYRLRN